MPSNLPRPVLGIGCFIVSINTCAVDVSSFRIDTYPLTPPRFDNGTWSLKRRDKRETWLRGIRLQCFMAAAGPNLRSKAGLPILAGDFGVDVRFEHSR